jgi:hypothetical protein
MTTKSTPNTVVAPDYIPGLTHLRKECLLGFATLTILFFLFRIPGSYMAPAEQYCTAETKTYPSPCIRPSLFAFESICALTFVVMATVSVKSWHIHQVPQTTIPQTPIGRVYGYSSESEKLAALSFVFQAWSVVFTPFIPEFYSNIMMAHHIMAALASYMALQYQYYHYYAVFFLALTEVSSVPLVIISLGKYYPTYFGTFVPIAQPLFAITFSYYRVYLWQKVSVGLWSDAIAVLKKKDKNNVSIAEQFRPGKTLCLYVYLFIDVLLGFLQLFWFTTILFEVMKVMGIDVGSINPGFD